MGDGGPWRAGYLAVFRSPGSPQRKCLDGLILQLDNAARARTIALNISLGLTGFQAFPGVVSAAGLGVLKGLGVPAHATGGVLTTPQVGVIAEAGPEAVVPLNKAGGFGTTKPHHDRGPER
jgi:hypothetical protein